MRTGKPKFKNFKLHQQLKNSDFGFFLAEIYLN